MSSLAWKRLTHEPEGELNSGLREELRALARGPKAPPGLEDRVVVALENRGLLRTGTSRGAARAWWLGAAAACVLIFAAGVFLGRHRPSAASAPAGEEFMLLLYRLEDSVESDPQQEAQLVREYSDWARQERARGQLLGGEKLNDEALLLTGVAEPPKKIPKEELVGGYFVIVAQNLDAAVAIARTCPHLQHGGRLVIGPIDRTP